MMWFLRRRKVGRVRVVEPAAAMWLMILLLVGAHPAYASSSSRDVELARRAFHIGFPIYEMMRTRQNALARAAETGRPAFNHFAHRRTLADHTNRQVTTPNNDTLYSGAWLDLREGPVELFVPDIGSRYHSVALLDLHTDNVAVLGTRTRPPGDVRYLIVGPEWREAAPTGKRLVRSSSNDLWAILRVLVDGPADLPAATAAQARFTLSPVIARPHAGEVAVTTWRDPANFLDVVNHALARSPMAPPLAARLKELQRVGLIPGRQGTYRDLPSRIQRLWRDNVAPFAEDLGGGLASAGDLKAGWTYPRPGIGRFGDDDLYRARIALSGLGALPAEEAIYFTASLDEKGHPLVGACRYIATIPADVPADAFWSLSMYEVASDGRLFFADNPIARYAVGNRSLATPARDEPYRIGIELNHTGVAGGEWLPSPPGLFQLVFRAYLPHSELLGGGFMLPSIERVSCH